MKKSIFKLGALSISLLSLALLFKLMHWPGGNIMLILTLGGLVPITSFLAAQYLGKEEDENEDDREFLGTNPQKRATSQ